MSRCAIATHASQMYTRGPATSLATSASGRPQNEHLSERLKRIGTSLNLRIAKLPSHQITKLPNYQITKLPNYQPAWEQWR
jgi:hypothetical protein